MRVLSVCTANQCRSVMLEASLRAAFSERGIPGTVSSAGTEARGQQPATSEVRRVLAKRGWGVEDHRSRHVSAVDEGPFDLVLTAERQHLMAVVEHVGVPRHRVFSLIELARLLGTSPAFPGEPLESYLERLSATRGLHGFLTTAPSPDDLPDPTGKGRRAHRKTLEQVESLSDAIVADLPFGWPPPVPDSMNGRPLPF